MAGGIDWFRWHHGSVTDPKFQLVAKKAGARLGDVITVWAFVLEAASSNAERGTIGPLDFETMDFLLGADDGTAVRILDAMTQRGLIEGSQIAQWDKRQPKREREDDGAADRKRAQRERDAAAKLVPPSNPLPEHVTPCHATSHQETPRGEESRGEENSSLRSEKAQRKRSASSPAQLVTVETMVAEGVDPAHARDWLKARGKHPLTPTAWDLLKDEADKAGITPARAVEICAAKSWRGFDSTWDWPGKRIGAPPGAAPVNRQEALEQRNREVASKWAANKQRELEAADAAK